MSRLNRMAPRPFTFALIGVLFCAFPAFAQKPSEKMVAFTGVVEAAFPKWDLDHDGVLQSGEVDHWINDPSLKDKEAAAIVAIKTMQRKYLKSRKEMFEPTLRELETDDVELESTEDEIEGGRGKTYSLGSGFDAALRRLPQVNRKLYAKDGPDFASMRQGSVGNCFLFSCLGYMAKNSPERITSMIGRTPDGAYTVKLGGESVKVGPLSDAKIILNNSQESLGDGLWIPILEEAISMRLRDASEYEPDTDEVTDAIAMGGSSAKVIRVISGHKAVTIKFHKPGRNIKATDLGQVLRGIITRALADKRIIKLGMSAEPRNGAKKIPFLGYHHAYAIVGYEPKTDTLTVWNPWGKTKMPKETPGIKNGYPTTHGIFEIPLTVVISEFDRVVYEP